MAKRDEYADTDKTGAPNNRAAFTSEVPSALREAGTPSSVPLPWSASSRPPANKPVGEGDD